MPRWLAGRLDSPETHEHWPALLPTQNNKLQHVEIHYRYVIDPSARLNASKSC